MKTKCLIYCTKGELLWSFNYNKAFVLDRRYNRMIDNPERIWQVNGKVVAYFECDKVEKYYNAGQLVSEKPNDIMNIICSKASITRDDLDDYCEGKHFYTIHISQLEIFDKPLELSDLSLTKAPQNMCLVEYEGERYCLISIRPEWVAKILNGEKTIEVRKKVLKGMMDRGGL